MMESLVQIGNSNATKVNFSKCIIYQKQRKERLTSNVPRCFNVREANAMKTTTFWIVSIFLNQMAC